MRRPREFDIVEKSPDEKVGKQAALGRCAQPMAAIPGLHRPIGILSGVVVLSNPVLQRTMARDKGGSRALFEPGKILLMKQSYPVAREPIKKGQEIPTDMRLGRSTAMALGDIVAGDGNYEVAD
jgi:hypothetical protein